LVEVADVEYLGNLFLFFENGLHLLSTAVLALRLEGLVYHLLFALLYKQIEYYQPFETFLFSIRIRFNRFSFRSWKASTISSAQML
jgi:hypothetical protein